MVPGRRVLAPAFSECVRGRPKTIDLPEKARFREDRGAVRRGEGRAVEAAALRHPEACRDAAALRPPAGARRRLQVLGGDARARRSIPHDKRLAVEVEDHPLDYGDFEGTIPKGQYGGGTVHAVGPRLLGAGGRCRTRRLEKGELKFALDGERLQGSWVLVRMKRDRNGGKRTNWLLIKHRDEDARRGRRRRDAARRTDSVASGRTMEEIAAGKGKAPKPFMTGEGAARPTRSGSQQSRRGAARPARGKPAPRSQRRRRPKTVDSHAGLRRAAALPSWSSGRRPATGWAHEIKFDGYRMQLRVEGGKATLQDPQGPRLDRRSSRRSPRRPTTLPDCIIDGEVVRARRQRRAGFRRRCRRRCRTARPTTWSSSPSTCCSPRARICARCRCASARTRLKALLDEAAATAQHPLRRAFRDRRRRGAAVGLPAVARRHRLQAARRALPLRPQRQLDQGQVPRRP